MMKKRNLAIAMSLLAGLCANALASPAVASAGYMGEVMFTFNKSCPTGTMLADGSLLNVSEHPMLAFQIGAKYGGDGVTNFALPNIAVDLKTGTLQKSISTQPIACINTNGTFYQD